MDWRIAPTVRTAGHQATSSPLRHANLFLPLSSLQSPVGVSVGDDRKFNVVDVCRIDDELRTQKITVFTSHTGDKRLLRGRRKTH